MTYNQLLAESAAKTKNIVCMGLDPQLDAFNAGATTEDIVKFFEELFNQMVAEGLSPAAFKPNIGYWQALDKPRKGDFSGSLALSEVLDMVEELFPGIPVILDSKRGDIARSSLNYAIEAFDCWNTAAVTVSPYMGTDSITPFNAEGKGVYILNRTSNPGGAIVQNRVVIDQVDEHVTYPLYIGMSHFIFSLDMQNLGAVVGATNLNELRDIATYYQDKAIALLIPGVGSQGGSAEEVISVLKDVDYDLSLVRINSSSALTHPWKKGPMPENHLELCMKNIRDLIKNCSL